jgi:seryl-tRNA(Sec) selenium transferase
MASAIDKIEALKAVGAEELANQTLAKVLQSEIDRLKQDQQRLKIELEDLEKQHQMTSEECCRKFEAGELGDAIKFFEWTSLYEIYQANAQTLRVLEEKLR